MDQILGLNGTKKPAVEIRHYELNFTLCPFMNLLEPL
jgi:hypothetical protein